MKAILERLWGYLLIKVQFFRKKTPWKTDNSIFSEKFGWCTLEKVQGFAGYSAEELYVQQYVLAELSKAVMDSFILLLSTRVTREWELF